MVKNKKERESAERLSRENNGKAERHLVTIGSHKEEDLETEGFLCS
jgi:hypothetical protein